MLNVSNVSKLNVRILNSEVSEALFNLRGMLNSRSRTTWLKKKK